MLELSIMLFTCVCVVVNGVLLGGLYTLKRMESSERTSTRETVDLYKQLVRRNNHGN